MLLSAIERIEDILDPIVDKNANFIGGIIAPGLKIQAKSLSQFTSKLPKLKIEAPDNAIGKDTLFYRKINYFSLAHAKSSDRPD